MFLSDLSDKVGADAPLDSVHAVFMNCNSQAFTQMWTALLSKTNVTDLRDLRLKKVTGDVTGGDVMSPLLNCSSITSLYILHLDYTADWWKSGDALPQLCTFMGRQTKLAGFDFGVNEMTTRQTTELLQCIA